MWRYERPALACCLISLLLGAASLAAAVCAGLTLGLPGLRRAVEPPPTSPAVPLETVVLQEDFSSAGGDWYQGTDAYATHEIVDGGYRILVHEPNYNSWVYTGLDLADAVVQVKAEFTAGPSDGILGVLCRAQDDRNFLAGYVSADGWISLFRTQDDESTALLPEEWIETDLLRPNGPNELTLQCLGDRIELILNGELAAEGSDSTFSRGDFALLAGTYEVPGTDVRFDDLVVGVP